MLPATGAQVVQAPLPNCQRKGCLLAASTLARILFDFTRDSYSQAQHNEAEQPDSRQRIKSRNDEQRVHLKHYAMAVAWQKVKTTTKAQVVKEILSHAAFNVYAHAALDFLAHRDLSTWCGMHDILRSRKREGNYAFVDSSEGFAMLMQAFENYLCLQAWPLTHPGLIHDMCPRQLDPAVHDGEVLHWFTELVRLNRRTLTLIVPLYNEPSPDHGL